MPRVSSDSPTKLVAVPADRAMRGWRRGSTGWSPFGSCGTLDCGRARSSIEWRRGGSSRCGGACTRSGTKAEARGPPAGGGLGVWVRRRAEPPVCSRSLGPACHEALAGRGDRCRDGVPGPSDAASTFTVCASSTCATSRSCGGHSDDDGRADPGWISVRWLPDRKVERALEQAHVLQLVVPGSIEDALERAKGRRTAALRRLLAAEGRRPTFTRSELEEAFLALCRRGGLPDPEVNAHLCGYEVDFLWRKQRRRGRGRRVRLPFDPERPGTRPAKGRRPRAHQLPRGPLHPRPGDLRARRHATSAPAGSSSVSSTTVRVRCRGTPCTSAPGRCSTARCRAGAAARPSSRGNQLARVHGARADLPLLRRPAAAARRRRCGRQALGRSAARRPPAARAGRGCRRRS